MFSGIGRARIAILALGFIGVAASGAAAQESTNRVGAETDWSVFMEQSPRECWSVSAPTDSRIVDPDGNPTDGRRGDILLFVFYRPDAGVNGQVTFTGGYPFAGGSTVTVTIGSESYELFTEGEWAWPATPEDDARLIAAMKRGRTAEVRGRSGRGNTTIDDFSLLGFTAAVEDAGARCSG